MALALKFETQRPQRSQREKLQILSAISAASAFQIVRRRTSVDWIFRKFVLFCSLGQRYDRRRLQPHLRPLPAYLFGRNRCVPVTLCRVAASCKSELLAPPVLRCRNCCARKKLRGYARRRNR